MNDQSGTSKCRKIALERFVLPFGEKEDAVRISGLEMVGFIGVMIIGSQFGAMFDFL